LGKRRKKREKQFFKGIKEKREKERKGEASLKTPRMGKNAGKKKKGGPFLFCRKRRKRGVLTNEFSPVWGKKKKKTPYNS